MEKRMPHYPLAGIQAPMISIQDMNLTLSARSGIREAGLAQTDALAVIQGLTRRNFYKSMTTHADHRIWQDVYHGEWEGRALYIKFQQVSDYFVVSFKEL